MSDPSEQEPRPAEETPAGRDEPQPIQAAPAQPQAEPAPQVESAPMPPEVLEAAVETAPVQAAPRTAPSAADALPRQWYVIHAQTGQEDKVKASVDTKVQQGVVGSLISQVLIPTEKVSEVRSGKKRISERKFFPGYVLVEMALTDETWHLIKNTPGVTGFIGAGHRPVALSEDEVAQILRQTEEKKERPTPRVMFEKGEGVRVIEGPFTNFSGTIEEVNLNRGKLKAMVSIFGRATPLELEFWQVEKL